MSAEIFEVNKNEENELIRKIDRQMDGNLEKLEKFNQRLDDFIKLKGKDEVERQFIDLQVGTWIDKIQFHNREELSFIFNEGTEKRVSQENGIYVIGETTYSFTGIPKEVDLHIERHNSACLALEKTFSNGIFPTGQEWLKYLYEDFPAARKNDPDYLYNLNDTVRFCKRIDHFRSYLTTGLTEVISSFPDMPNVIICTLSMSRSSVLILSRILKKVNNRRVNKLTIYEGGLSEYSCNSYVYYIPDLWKLPSSFDHRILSEKQNQAPLDDMIARALGVDRIKYCTENSTLILGAYQPILDIVAVKGKVMRKSCNDFSYAQFMYVPHKPWSIVCLTRNGVLPYLDDSVVQSARSVFTSRNRVFINMIHCNIMRNVMMANKTQRSLLRGKNLLDNLKSNPFSTVFQFRTMLVPVPLTSKKIAYETANPVDSLELVVKVGDLKAGDPYTSNDLYSLGWDGNLVQRALSLGMIVAHSHSSQYFYYKYTRTNPSYRKHLDRVRGDIIKRVAILEANGNVVTTNKHFPDYDALAYPQIDFANHNGRDYSLQAPYDVVDRANQGYEVESLTLMRFKQERTEDHGPQTNVTKRAKYSKKNARNKKNASKSLKSDSARNSGARKTKARYKKTANKNGPSEVHGTKKKKYVFKNKSETSNSSNANDADKNIKKKRYRVKKKDPDLSFSSEPTISQVVDCGVKIKLDHELGLDPSPVTSVPEISVSLEFNDNPTDWFRPSESDELFGSVTAYDYPAWNGVKLEWPDRKSVV